MEFLFKPKRLNDALKQMRVCQLSVSFEKMYHFFFIKLSKLDSPPNFQFILIFIQILKIEANYNSFVLNGF